MVGPTVATPLVMHAQSSDYEASRTKCGSCCKGLEIRYYWYTSNPRCANSLRKLSPLKKKISSHCYTDQEGLYLYLLCTSVTHQ